MQMTKQIAAIVYKAWTVLIEDDVWKIRISPSVKLYEVLDFMWLNAHKTT